MFMAVVSAIFMILFLVNTETEAEKRKKCIVYGIYGL